MLQYYQHKSFKLKAHIHVQEGPLQIRVHKLVSAVAHVEFHLP